MGKPLPAPLDRALAKLIASPALAGFYLAGGSAIACHLRHRVSDDLDLFNDTRFDPRELHARLVASVPGVELKDLSTIMLRVRVGGAPVDLVHPLYALLDPAGRGPHGVPLAGLRDLGAMKLSTIAQRGRRRDFWDLATILDSGIRLPDLVDAYLKKYRLGAADVYHVARGLTYVADAEAEPAFPKGLTKKRWAEIKRLFEKLAPTLL